jgi:hypothetical protein
MSDVRPLFLRNEPAAVREAAMKPEAVLAVLNAADEWVSAQEALVAAMQVSEDTEADHQAVDVAGTRLVIAVMRWHSSA